MSTALACAALVVVVGALARGLARAPGRARPGPERLAVGLRRVSAWLRRTRAGASWRERRRRHVLRREWPEAADEIASTVRAGASLLQALASVATRGGVAAAVIDGVVRPVERGQSLANVACRWTGRAGSHDEALLAEAVHLAATTGRADPMLFETVADAIRERLALEGELRAQTAQARTSAAVLALLPAGFTLLVASSDPDVVAFLFRSSAGWACLGCGLLLEVSGAWWMHRMIRSAAP